KEMIAAILETRGPVLKTSGNLNNEIGVPLTLFGFEHAHVAAILEMGMNHRGEIGRMTSMVRPDAGLITVVQGAHLQGVGSLEGVAAAKGELFGGLHKEAKAVVNLDDPRIIAQAKAAGRAEITFGRSPKAHIRILSVEPQGQVGLHVHLGYGE